MVRWTKEKEWHQIHFTLYSLFWWMRAYVHFFQAQDCENVRFFFMNDNYVHHLIRVRNRVSSTFHTLWCKNHNALHLYYISRSSCCHSTFALDMHQIMLFVITISSPPSTASNSVWCNGVCTECILPDLSAKCARYSKQKLANKYDNITEKLFAELWQASWNYSLIQYSTYKTRSNWNSTLLLFRYLSHNDCYSSKKQQKCICSHDWHVHTHTHTDRKWSMRHDVAADSNRNLFINILHCDVANLRICTPSETIWHFDCTDNSWQKSTFILATMWELLLRCSHFFLNGMNALLAKKTLTLRMHHAQVVWFHCRSQFLSYHRTSRALPLIFHLCVSFRPNESAKECMMKWSHFGT